MIPHGMQIFLALAPIDLRSSFDRLAGLAKDQIGYDARSGALFVFVGKRRTALKVLFFDGSGLCLFYKRLDKSTFRWPDPPGEGVTHVEVDDVALEARLDGLTLDATPKRAVH